MSQNVSTATVHHSPRLHSGSANLKVFASDVYEYVAVDGQVRFEKQSIAHNPAHAQSFTCCLQETALIGLL
jgi:hypothetical protein